MPASKTSEQQAASWDSWFPSRVHLHPSVERDDDEIEDLNLASMEDDPYIYFLTPTPSSYAGDEVMDFDMEFDAGIEDAKHPTQVVRSISPSSLGGLSRPPPPTSSPPRSPTTPDLDYDLSATPDEQEQYDYMDNSWPPKHAHPLSLPRRVKDKFKGHSKQDDIIDTILPPPPHSLRRSTRGRAVSRSVAPLLVGATGGSSRRRKSMAAPSRLSPHAWREPSPDVWSIEEEAEEEAISEAEESGVIEGGAKTGALDIPAAKPKKKVRFVLPALEDTRGGY